MQEVWNDNYDATRMINIQELRRLRDDVLTGKLEHACITAVFDKVLDELEAAKQAMPEIDPRQLSNEELENWTAYHNNALLELYEEQRRRRT